jgi:hypothetical protein
MTEYTPDTTPEPQEPRRLVLGTVAWLWVAAPFGYGLYELVLKLRQLFTG